MKIFIFTIILFNFRIIILDNKVITLNKERKNFSLLGTLAQSFMSGNILKGILPTQNNGVFSGFMNTVQSALTGGKGHNLMQQQQPQQQMHNMMGQETNQFSNDMQQQQQNLSTNLINSQHSTSNIFSNLASNFINK